MKLVYYDEMAYVTPEQWEQMIRGDLREKGRPSMNITDYENLLERFCDRFEKMFDQLGLAGAATPMGALEAHAKATEDGCNAIALGLNDVAEAIRLHTQAIVEIEEDVQFTPSAPIDMGEELDKMLLQSQEKGEG